jgi:hypothetical protein
MPLLEIINILSIFISILVLLFYIELLRIHLINLFFSIIEL